MNQAKQTGGAVLTGSGNAPAVGGSVNGTGSPTEPNPKPTELLNGAESRELLEIVKQQSEQIAKLMEMNTGAQQVIGKLGNELGQARRQQPAITPEMKRQFKGMLDDEDTALDAVGLIVQTTTKGTENQNNQLLDSFFTARATDPQLREVSFDEYKWQALKSGVPLEQLAESENAKRFLHTIVSSRPVDIEAVRNAAKAEGAKEAEERFAALLKEKGIAGLTLPSSNGGGNPPIESAAPLTDDEEQDKFAISMALGARQITKAQVPQEKLRRYGL